MNEPLAVLLDTQTPFGSLCPDEAETDVWRRCGEHQASGKPGKALWKTLGARHPGPFDVTAGGINLRIYPTENYGDRLIAMTGQLPERDEIALIAPYLKPGGSFIDIGANIGLYAIHAGRALGPEGRVLAFEPHPRTASKLRFNLEANACGNVRVFEHALGGEEATARFFPDEGKNAGRSSMIAEAVGKAGEGIETRVRPLAQVLREEGVTAPDLIKIDIEGYEDRVLVPLLTRGHASLLAKTILLEDAHKDLWAGDLAACLADAGYAQKAATDTNRLYVRRSLE